MILYLEDWQRYPNAIVDINTPNKTFVELAGLYKKMGIKNHAFLLALHNPALVGIDPHSPNLTEAEKLMIQDEAIINPWYFFRACAKAPPLAGIDPLPFQANRGNIATIWLFFNSIMTLMIQPRQTGKSFTCDSIMSGLLNLWCSNTKINLLTKDDPLRIETVGRVKEIISYLPEYLNYRTKKDNNNGESIRIGIHNNIYKTYVAQASPKLAFNAARGLSSPIMHIDEFAYFKNIRTTLPAALPATGAAMEEAEMKGAPNGVILTTTAGWLDSESGKYAYEFYENCAPWTEKMFDVTNRKKLRKVIRTASANNDETVIVDMNHRQLGYTDAWLKSRIKKAKSSMSEAETDFLNIWASGSNSSPFSKQLLAKLKQNINDEPIQDISQTGYIIRWYEPMESLLNTQLVMGLDTSDAVGKDDIALVIRKASNAEVVAVAQVNETNTIKFAHWVSELMLTLTKSVMIIERRATGTAIADYIMNFLTANGINPYSRMFNWIVQDKTANFIRFEAMSQHGKYEDFQDKHRTETGFATSAFGRAARDKLYGISMKKSMEYTHTKVYDKKLIGQITTLTIRNNRIDHSSGKKDDLVIAWLLGYWFLEFAKNVDFYGWDSSTVLSSVRYNTAETASEKAEVDLLASTRKTIDSLLTTLDSKDDEFSINLIVNKIVKLKAKLKGEAQDHLNIENALKETLLLKKEDTQTSKDFYIPQF